MHFMLITHNMRYSPPDHVHFVVRKKYHLLRESNFVQFVTNSILDVLGRYDQIMSIWYEWRTKVISSLTDILSAPADPPCNASLLLVIPFLINILSEYFFSVSLRYDMNSQWYLSRSSDYPKCGEKKHFSNSISNSRARSNTHKLFSFIIIL